MHHLDLSRVEPRAVREDLDGARLLQDIDRVGFLGDSGVLTPSRPRRRGDLLVALHDQAGERQRLVGELLHRA